MKYFFFLTFLPCFVFAQDQIEISVVPKPYNPKPYFSRINNTGIKKVTIISKENQQHFRDDTLFVYQYNNIGQQISSQRYDRNRMTSKTVMEYDSNNNQTQWRIIEINGLLNTITNFYYNQYNQLDSTAQISYRENKIINTSRNAYQYEKGKIKSRQKIVNDILNRDDYYRYKDSLLIEFKSMVSPKGYLVSDYSYDNNNHLIEINTTHFFDTRHELWNKKNITYENEKVVAEEELTSDNKKILTGYYYNTDNKLQKITSSFDDKKQEIEFEYNDFGIKQISVNANSNSAYLKFYIPAGIENFSLPVLYKEKLMTIRYLE